MHAKALPCLELGLSHCLACKATLPSASSPLRHTTISPGPDSAALLLPLCSGPRLCVCRSRPTALFDSPSFVPRCRRASSPHSSPRLCIPGLVSHSSSQDVYQAARPRLHILTPFLRFNLRLASVVCVLRPTLEVHAASLFGLSLSIATQLYAKPPSRPCFQTGSEFVPDSCLSSRSSCVPCFCASSPKFQPCLHFGTASSTVRSLVGLSPLCFSCPCPLPPVSSVVRITSSYIILQDA